MRRATSALAVALAMLSMPRAADAAGLGLTVEGLYGIARPPEANFSAAVSGAANDQNFSEDTLQIAGLDALLNFGAFELGAILDTTWDTNSVTQSALGGLAGLRFGDKLRLDLLAEAGGHRYGNVLDDPSVVSGSSSNQWLFYVGLRPGLSYRFGNPESLGILVGVWGFARWDVSDKNVPVTVGGAGGTAPGDVKLGGTSIGATLRLGIEL